MLTFYITIFPVVNLFSLLYLIFFVKGLMAEKKMFATRVDGDVLKALKHLSVDTELPISALLEEAIRDLLDKYEEESKE